MTIRGQNAREKDADENQEQRSSRCPTFLLRGSRMSVKIGSAEHFVNLHRAITTSDSE